MRKMILVIIGAAALVVPATGRADILGSAYLNNAAASDAVIGFTHGAPDATFTVPSPTNAACAGNFAGDTLCFNTGYFGNTSPYTLGGFLSSGGATVLTGVASLGANLDNTVFEFVGTVSVTTGETFQAGHDDGLQLLIGTDLVIDAPFGTAFTTTPATYTGPTGTFSFDLVYGECCGAPAALGISLPLINTVIATPEPASLAIIGGGIAGLAAARRRRKTA